MRQSAEALKPLYDLMVKEVLASRVIHTDDTPVDVPLSELKLRYWYTIDSNQPQIFSCDYMAGQDCQGKVLVTGTFAPASGANLMIIAIIRISAWQSCSRPLITGRLTSPTPESASPNSTEKNSTWRISPQRGGRGWAMTGA
jgi:hypothetical protein